MNTLPITLLDRLGHPDKSTRSAAVLELHRLDHPDKLAVLIQSLRTEPDLFVREDITYAVMNMGHAAVAALCQLLTDADANVRHHAAHTLGKIGDPAAVDALINVLDDDDSRVVLKAAFALAQIGDERALPALVDLLGDDDREVQTGLLNIIESFDTAAVPLLMAALDHERWQVREQVIDALGVIGDHAALPALTDALQDDHWQVRFAAVTALSHIGPVAKNALEQIPTDPDPRVSELVAQVLRRMSQRVAVKARVTRIE
jgi:HEAT repeat protein